MFIGLLFAAEPVPDFLGNLVRAFQQQLLAAANTDPTAAPSPPPYYIGPMPLTSVGMGVVCEQQFDTGNTPLTYISHVNVTIINLLYHSDV